MQIIAHRRNTIEELLMTPPDHGVEIDIRSSGKRLVLQHDPFKEGADFDEWLERFHHKTLILNVKEEGLETACLTRMKAHGIDDFFFLDQSVPFLVKTSGAGERRCAVRVSEFEAVESALALAARIDWAWIDCFTRFPLNPSDGARLKDAGLKLCLVSPELQGRVDEAEIKQLRALIADPALAMDAVCTKKAAWWTS